MNTRAFNNTDEEILAERACLVGVIRPNVAEWIVEDQLEELAALADTAGAEVLYRVTQRRMKLHPATMIGPGKVKEIATHCRNNDIRLTIFDDDLSPAQVRNLESILPGKVLDRSGLILDIFASRAHTRESRVQVELAQLEYYYPRLTRQWGHLKGQQGGIGFRGPGETQLEVDRRAVQDRISRLKKELNKIVKQRATRRKGRKDTPTAALVGYTNVGKSTLLNALSGERMMHLWKTASLRPLIQRQDGLKHLPVILSLFLILLVLSGNYPTIWLHPFDPPSRRSMSPISSCILRTYPIHSVLNRLSRQKRCLQNWAPVKNLRFWYLIK